MEQDGEFSQQSGKCLPTAPLLNYAGYADLSNRAVICLPGVFRITTQACSLLIMQPQEYQDF